MIDRLPLLLLASLLLLPQPGVAQDGAPRTCFRGQPPPACHSFWITEATWAARVARDGPLTSSQSSDLIASLEVGRMWNVSPRVALGAGLAVATNTDLHLALKPRARLWLTPDVALDGAPMLRVLGSARVPRLGVEAAVMVQDRVGLIAQVAPTTVYTFGSASDPAPRERLDVHLGLRLGSKLGIVGAIADAVALAVVVGWYVAVCSGGACD